jgi:hypothetical protein
MYVEGQFYYMLLLTLYPFAQKDVYVRNNRKNLILCKKDNFKDGGWVKES